MKKILIFTAALLSLPVAANAHPRLKAAGPPPGSVVAASPKALRIQFNEPVELLFSGVEVTNAKGEKQPTGTPVTSGADKTQMIVPLTISLSPGRYTVAWHAVGEGSYTFSIKK